MINKIELNRTKEYLEEQLENPSRFSFKQLKELKRIYQETLKNIDKVERDK